MSFRKMATAEEVMGEIGENCNDKVFLITGANGGLGYFVAEALLKQKPGPRQIIMACRNVIKAEDAKKKLLESTEVNSGKISIVNVDLSDLASIASMEANVDKIDCLINNAGIQALPNFTQSKQGYELQWAVNHLGHHYLTKKLILLLKKSSSPRVVTISSKSHKQMAVSDVNKAIRPQIESTYGSWSSYGNSKLCNVAFTKGIQARFPDIHCYSVHPGWVMEKSSLWDPVKKSLYSWTHPMFHMVISIIRGIGSIFTTDIKSMDQGIASILVCAVEDAEKLEDGGYYEDCNIATARSDIDKEVVNLLWNESEDKIQKFEESQL